MIILMVSGGETDENLLVDTYRGLKEQPFVIGVDKGCRALVNSGISIDLAIGDFDSVGDFYEKAVSSAKEVISLNPVKDDTDTEAAVMQALERRPERVIILGATGSRVDHMLANIFLLGRFADNDIPAELIDKHNRIRLIRNSFTLYKEELFGKYISVIPYGDRIEALTLKGFKYTADGLRIERCSSRGISNELIDNEGIIMTSDPALIIESRD